MVFTLIVAGGIGIRMHSNDIPKQFLLICGKPIIIYTLEKFDKSPKVDSIVIACLPDYIDKLWDLIKENHIKKVVSIVPGGKTRQDSINNGLTEIGKLTKDPEKDLVMINDAVRPLVSEELIEANIQIAKRYGTCLTVAPLVETVMIVKNDVVQEVEYRPDCKLGRAPQTYKFSLVKSVFDRVEAEGRHDFIDPESMFLHYDIHPHVYVCDDPNFKITTHTDYVIFRSFLEAVEDEQFINIDVEKKK